MLLTFKNHQSKQWEKECIKTRRYLWLRKRRLEMFNIDPKSKVLDLGCGDGLNIKLLKQKGIKKITGVDVSPYLIKLSQQNNPDTKFYLASADKLPFRSSTFDIVLLDSVFHHLINHEKSLKEIKRVLKKEGGLLFIDPHKSILRKLLDLLTKSSFANYLPFLRFRKPAYLAEEDLINNWLEQEENFMKLLEKEGFKKQFLRIDLLSSVGSYKKL